MDTYEAVQEWGRLKLQEVFPHAKIKRDSVSIYVNAEHEHRVDYQCYANAVIEIESGKHSLSIEAYDFNLVQFVNEVNEISYQRSEK